MKNDHDPLNSAINAVLRLSEEARNLRPGGKIVITYHEMRRFDCYTLSVVQPDGDSVVITDGEPMPRWNRADPAAFFLEFMAGVGRLADAEAERRRAREEGDDERARDLLHLAADLDAPLPAHAEMLE